MADYIIDDRIAIPADPDARFLKATLDRLAKAKPGTLEFADDTSARTVIAHATTKAMFGNLAEMVDYRPQFHLDLLRRVPEKMWTTTRDTWSATYPLALARGIADKRTDKKVCFADELVPMYDDELRGVLAAVTTKAVEDVKVYSDALARRIGTLATRDQLIALWTKCSAGTWRFIRALDTTAFIEAYRKAPRERYKDAAWTFEALRRGLLDEKMLLADIANAQKNFGFAVRSLFESPQRATHHGEWTAEEVCAGISDACRHAQTLRAPLRQLLDVERAKVSGPVDLKSRGLLFLFAVCYDDELSSWFTGVCEADKAWFRKKDSYPELISDALGDAFFARDDGDEVLAAMAKHIDGKTFEELFAQARSRAASNRALANPGAPVDIQWGRTKTADAERMLLAAEDPRPLVDAGITSDDPVAVLNAFLAAAGYSLTWRDNKKPDELKARALWSWAFMERALHALERLYTPDAPDGKALDQLIGGGHTASYMFEPALRGLFWLKAGDDAERETFIDAVLVPLYTSTSNVKFKKWIEPIVVGERPALAESSHDRLLRLAAETTKGGGETVARSFVFCGATPPQKHTINRLYGPPIGVTAKTWPKHGKKRMQHLITLETRFLAPSVAAAFEKAGTSAVAVFISSYLDHNAFSPGTDHVAVVHLTAKDLERGADTIDASDETEAGITLDAVTCELPAAVYKGGIKQGALWELRRLLDQRDFVTTDRTSPSWIQEPEGGPGFLFELDEAFARQLNLGDAGRFYVFDDTAFLQN